MKHLFVLVVALGFAIGTGWAADKPTLNVLDFGAKADGVTKDTDAIQKALDACGENGGGTVLLPVGMYLTGGIILHANTTLQMEKGASLIGSPDIADYPVVNVRWEGEFREGHDDQLGALFHIANIIFSGGEADFREVRFGKRIASQPGTRQRLMPPVCDMPQRLPQLPRKVLFSVQLIEDFERLQSIRRDMIQNNLQHFRESVPIQRRTVGDFAFPLVEQFAA